MTRYTIHFDERNGRVGERTETVTADTSEITDSGALALYKQASGKNVKLSDMNQKFLVAAFNDWKRVNSHPTE